MEKSNSIQMKYFVLKPKGKNIYAEASRKAMRAYASHIESENKQLSKELREWADKEHFNCEYTIPISGNDGRSAF